MRKPSAAIGSLLFLFVGPGIVIGLIPWLLSRWEFHRPTPYWAVARVVGAVLIAAGVVVILQAFARFVLEGLGTPVPAAPPRRLVVGGLYRHVRNPMYVALVTASLGQALLFGQPVLLGYAVLVWLAPAAYVHWREEPVLVRRFGADYEEYRRHVRAWIPRLRPWRPTHPPT